MGATPPIVNPVMALTSLALGRPTLPSRERAAGRLLLQASMIAGHQRHDETLIDVEHKGFDDGTQFTADGVGRVWRCGLCL